MTTWQASAVEAMCFIEFGPRWDTLTDTAKDRYRANEAEKLRAALPLIEVTPGMQETVAKIKLRRIKEEGRHNKGITAAIIEDGKAMLRACADEGKDQ
jgi:hypothetical protein